MKICRFVLASALTACLMGGCPTMAMAGDTDPLFINLTSDDGHRVNMALAFGGNQAKRGHPLTVFLNDRSVLAASKANSEKFAEQQKAMEALLAAGANIYICPMCMKHFGVQEADQLPGLKVGNPELLGGALFKDGTKTLTW